MRIPPVLAFALCTLVWGTTWLAIKVGYGGLDAVWGASLRFLLAGLLLLPLVLLRRATAPPGLRPVAVVLFVGLVLFGFDYGLIYWGEQYLTSGLTAILFGTMPLFVALIGAGLIPTERVGARHFAGILIGLGGLVLIFSHDLTFQNTFLVPMLAIIGSAAAAALSSVVVRRWGRDLPPLVLNSGAMLVGGLALLGASLALGERVAVPRTLNSLLALGYLVVFGSMITFFLYWDLVKRWDHHRAGLIPILTPVVAVVTGLAVGERLTTSQWVGSAAVLFGVAVSLYRFRLPWARPASVPSAGK